MIKLSRLASRNIICFLKGGHFIARTSISFIRLSGRTYCNGHFGRNRESKRFTDSCQIKSIDVKDTLERMGGICVKIRSVTVLGRFVQIMGFFN